MPAPKDHEAREYAVERVRGHRRLDTGVSAFFYGKTCAHCVKV